MSIENVIAYFWDGSVSTRENIDSLIGWLTALGLFGSFIIKKIQQRIEIKKQPYLTWDSAWYIKHEKTENELPILRLSLSPRIHFPEGFRPTSQYISIEVTFPKEISGLDKHTKYSGLRKTPDGKITLPGSKNQHVGIYDERVFAHDLVALEIRAGLDLTQQVMTAEMLVDGKPVGKRLDFELEGLMEICL